MSELDSRNASGGTAPLLRSLLVIAAMLIFIGGLTIAGIFYTNTPQPNAPMMMAALAIGLTGLFFAVTLVSLSAMLGMMGATNGAGAAPQEDVRPALERLEQALRTLNAMQSREHASAQAVASAQATLPPAQLAAVEQLRDVMLMDPEQQKRYAARHWSRRKQAHLDAIEREVLVGEWPSVFARLDELQIVMPGDAQLAEMRERVESEQNSRLDEELRVARGRLRQLAGASLWQQAEDLAAALQAKYPGKADADRLVEDVRRDREAWERENMDRLFRDIAAATERRQWRQAVLAAEEFVRRYPLDSRAEALRLDLKPLQENAAAQERKEQEEHFKDLLKHQRYNEAISVARAVVQKYPQSPTATELNKLLPRVEELARQEAARAAQQTVAGVPATVGA